MTNTIRKINNLNTKRLFVVSAAIIVFSIVFYVYFINLTVLNGTKIELLTDNVSNLESEISQTELEIVESRRRIDKILAQEEGFVSLDQVVYLKTTSQTALNAIGNQ